jgi:hypothetical protein
MPVCQVSSKLPKVFGRSCGDKIILRAKNKLKGHNCLKIVGDSIPYVICTSTYLSLSLYQVSRKSPKGVRGVAKIMLGDRRTDRQTDNTQSNSMTIKRVLRKDSS